ncbi:MAG TPA: zinc-binding dehydrogenase [Bradyrhizobium sp.]|uniref:zinc-binding dehydrogenase n=1 Tax=Bradyrhizobium sp. TaxID=376 RepID=UPI002D7F6FDC|nr:zinc-binding dehydrogenase [Bradyrhizobium sp.]HET7886238.1 zinc-binding dehydrogenase [Bradyrhizobium sp.]
MAGDGKRGLQLRSLIKKSGELEISLLDVPTPEPSADEVVVRVEATPINPSDIGLLFGAADMSTAKASGSKDAPVVTAQVPEKAMRAMAGRLDESMPVGNEGAGVVIKTGSSDAAKALMGKTVAMIGGAMYSQFRTIRAGDCLVLPEDATPADGASCFVNPLTSLGMVETMRREGHKALVHTAAASNLGQMLNKICLKDGIALVNIVRSGEQAEILRKIGAKHVVDSTAPTFIEDLTAALIETGATIAFDAIGGGKLAGQILAGMEVAANKTATAYSRYGSNVHKQVYIYGMLDPGPTEINRTFGFAWSIGGWLLFPFLMKIGATDAARLRARVIAELKTTFASHYTQVLSLQEALQLPHIAGYGRRATGEKYLINPNKT